MAKISLAVLTSFDATAFSATPRHLRTDGVSQAEISRVQSALSQLTAASAPEKGTLVAPIEAHPKDVAWVELGATFRRIGATPPAPAAPPCVAPA